MSLLMGLLVWNVRRRQEALTTSTELAARELQRVADQVLLTRLTSHELRSPLTISTGYLRLLRESETDPDRAADLDIVREEVERISRTSERLLRLIRLQATTVSSRSTSTPSRTTCCAGGRASPPASGSSTRAPGWPTARPSGCASSSTPSSRTPCATPSRAR